ncbi:MAG: metallophosphoesterase family protein [Candidatus Heimdallarchaeota archaeon]|nr:MAG: metallophosphoesterase family protein [Candidatus Heimdallarchaeota archaeon]
MYSLGIISDIHSNIEALEACLTDMNFNYPEIEEIYCIGDLVGYGPDPKKCIKLIFKNTLISKIVKGNHEHYVDQTVTPPQVTSRAKAAIDYQINNIPLELRWELAQLPQFITTKHLNREITLVHGSPQYPLTAYVYPNSLEQKDLFQYMSNLEVDILALGHTHVPFIRKKVQNDKEYLMLNPGAIGQPRDNDHKASYAVIDVQNMDAEICRVEYDIDSVAKRIISVGLPESLASRLYKGI